MASSRLVTVCLRFAWHAGIRDTLCRSATARVAEVNRGIEIMRQALCRYPKHQPRLRGADATSDAPMQPADEPEVQLHLQPDDPQPKRDPVVQQSLPT